MPRYAEAHPRARRRSGCFPAFLCCLVLAWLVVVAVPNIARIYASERELDKAPKIEVRTPKPPNYYDLIGVDPLVSFDELRRLRRKHALEEHPDKHGNSLEAIEAYTEKDGMFATLLDGRTRCKYDKKQKIRTGMWPFQTCKDAFRQEYLKEAKEKLEVMEEAVAYAREAKRASGKKVSPEDEKLKVKVKVEVEQQQQQQQPLTPEPGLKDEAAPPEEKPQARPVVPVVTVEVDPEPEPLIPGVKSLGGAGWKVWEYGILYNWVVFKAWVVECGEKVFSALGSLAHIR